MASASGRQAIHAAWAAWAAAWHNTNNTMAQKGAACRNDTVPQKHPGFQAVAAKIGRGSGIRNPGAVLAAASRGASPAAKKANPRLKRVKG